MVIRVHNIAVRPRICIYIALRDVATVLWVGGLNSSNDEIQARITSFIYEPELFRRLVLLPKTSCQSSCWREWTSRAVLRPFFSLLFILYGNGHKQKQWLKVLSLWGTVHGDRGHRKQSAAGVEGQGRWCLVLLKRKQNKEITCEHSRNQQIKKQFQTFCCLWVSFYCVWI